MDDERSKLPEANALTEEGGQTQGLPVGRGSVRARIRVPEELPSPKKINAVILTPEIAHKERGTAVWEVYGTLTSFVYYDSVHYDSQDIAAAETAEAVPATEGLADDYFLDLAEAFPEKPMEGFGEPAAVNLLDLEILEGEACEISPGVQCLKHQVPFYLTLGQINQGDDPGEGLGLDQGAESVWESGIDLIPEVERVECLVLGPRILDLRVEMRLTASALWQTAFNGSAAEPPVGMAEARTETEAGTEFEAIEHSEPEVDFEPIEPMEFYDDPPATFFPEAIEPTENEFLVVFEELAEAAAELEVTTWSETIERIEEDPGPQAVIEEEEESQGGFKGNMTEIQKASGYIASEQRPAEQEPYQHEPYQQDKPYQHEPYQQDESQQGQFAEQYEESQSAEQDWMEEDLADEDLDSKLWEEADFPEAIDLAAVEGPADIREEMAGELPAEIEEIETEADWVLAEAEPEAGFDLAAEAEIEAEVEFEAEAGLTELTAEDGVETELEPAEAEFFEDETAGDYAEAEVPGEAEAAEAGLDELEETDSLNPAWVGIGYKSGSINRRRPGRAERDARMTAKNGELSERDSSTETMGHLGSGLPRPRSLNRSLSDGMGQPKEEYYPAANPPTGLPKIAGRHSGKRQSNVYRYYLIQPGDDWEKIAANYQLSIAAIKEANPAVPEDLAAGLRLKIPAAIHQDS